MAITQRGNRPGREKRLKGSQSRVCRLKNTGTEDIKNKLEQDINKREKKDQATRENVGKGGKSPEGGDVDNCGIVDVHWKDVDEFQDCMAARSARLIK